MSCVLLLTATIKPFDVIFCDRNSTILRYQDYLRAAKFWGGERLIDQIIFLENSGYDLNDIALCLERDVNKKVEIISFLESDHPRHRGKSYGELRLLSHAFEIPSLLDASHYVIKCTGRYLPLNFFRVWPKTINGPRADIIVNFFADDYADSRIFCAIPCFYTRYLLPLTPLADDSSGIYFEHLLARAVHAAVRDGMTRKPWPGGGFLIDGAQASTDTSFPYPMHKRLLYRAIAYVRNGLPMKWTLDAPVYTGQGSRKSKA